MIKKTAALAGAALLVGCAATYEPPKTAPANFSAKLDKPKAAIFAAAKRALVLDGYQILSSDASAGVLSTAKRQVRLTAADTDCGTTMGIPYIKDKRTITRVSVGAVVTDGGIRITPAIEGEYLKGHVTQSIALKCVSKGTLERALLAKIKGQLN